MGVMAYLTNTWDWVKARLGERTTWDGIVLMGVGIAVLAFPVITYIAAAAAIGWGLFTIVKSDCG